MTSLVRSRSQRIAAIVAARLSCSRSGFSRSSGGRGTSSRSPPGSSSRRPRPSRRRSSVARRGSDASSARARRARHRERPRARGDRLRDGAHPRAAGGVLRSRGGGARVRDDGGDRRRARGGVGRGRRGARARREEAAPRVHAPRARGAGRRDRHQRGALLYEPDGLRLRPVLRILQRHPLRHGHRRRDAAPHVPARLALHARGPRARRVGPRAQRIGRCFALALSRPRRRGRSRVCSRSAWRSPSRASRSPSMGPRSVTGRRRRPSPEPSVVAAPVLAATSSIRTVNARTRSRFS